MTPVRDGEEGIPGQDVPVSGVVGGEAAAFTAGPWTMGRMQRSSNFAKDTYAVHGDGTILCKVKGGVTEDAAVAAANARLIAAAPDLLEALRALAERTLEYVGPEPDEDDGLECDAEMRALARSAEAAIAKATGQ